MRIGSVVRVMCAGFVAAWGAAGTARAEGCAAAWAQYKGDAAHTARSPYSVSGTGHWTAYDSGAAKESIVSCAPALGADGAVYFVSRDWDLGLYRLYALNQDGTVRWVSSDNLMSWGASLIDEEARCPALAADGKIVYAQSYGYEADHGIMELGQGAIYAASADGKKAWSFATSKGIDSSPAIAHDGTIYILAYDGTLRALKPDGTEKWSFAVEKKYGAEPILEGMPAVAPDGTVYFARRDTLYAVKPGVASAALKWTCPLPIAGAWLTYIDGFSIMAGSDGTAYFFLWNADDSEAAETNKYFCAVDSSGKLKWKKQVTGDVAACALAADGTILLSVGANYYSASAPRLRGLNAATGALKWDYLLPEDKQPGGIVIGGDGTIYLAAEQDGVDDPDLILYAFAPSGAFASKTTLGKAGWGMRAPAIGANGRLYIASGDAIYAFGKKAQGHFTMMIEPGGIATYGKAKLKVTLEDQTKLCGKYRVDLSCAATGGDLKPSLSASEVWLGGSPGYQKAEVTLTYSTEPLSPYSLKPVNLISKTFTIEMHAWSPDKPSWPLVTAVYTITFKGGALSTRLPSIGLIAGPSVPFRIQDAIEDMEMRDWMRGPLPPPTPCARRPY